MSVALISAVDPYPTDAGKKIVLAGFLDYFADRYGPDNVHYIKIGSTPPKEDFPVHLHMVPGPSGAAVIGSIATKVTTGRVSLEEAFLGSRRTGMAIRRVIDEISPQLQVYDTVRMAQHAPTHVAAQQICYLDDLFSERYGRMLAAAQQYPDVNSSPLGNFADHVPRRLRPLATNKTSQTALLRAERVLVRRSEDRTARRFRRCLLVNDEEAEILTLRAGVPPGRVQSVPPLLTAPASLERQYPGAPEFVFLGDLSLAHNDDGLRWFLRAVWPIVLTRQPDAHIRVIGRQAGSEVLALADEFPDSVSVDGYVPSLAEALGAAAALVNPLRFGSGVKLKVIESLSRSLPVVSTPVGAEGIASGSGCGILVGSEPDEIADLLCSLTDPVLNAEVSTEAKAYFEATYSRKAVFDAYDAAFTLPAAQ
ncbi:MAG: glycosyltransferase family 4 protein [Actinomycetia bacterium]|nr:glycosyltransferase family 4 protein [Actinomycetes bacterium]